LDREKALDSFDNDPNCRFFVGTPHCGGKGLTLNKANYVIYYSNSFKLEDRLQSEDRCHRIGQTSNVTYIDLMSPDTVDEKIIKALKDKQSMADRILQSVESFEDFV
jgi:SNF2 family DNA or RNA helicase